jgi:hypothetical protein
MQTLRKIPQKYIWTKHAQYKMQHYRLSESLVKRVMRYPKRVEESIVPDTVAVMCPAYAGTLRRGTGASSKKYQEIWVMYVPTKAKKIRVITAWRYPGKSPERDPIPREVLDEVRSILF